MSSLEYGSSKACACMSLKVQTYLSHAVRHFHLLSSEKFRFGKNKIIKYKLCLIPPIELKLKVTTLTD